MLGSCMQRLVPMFGMNFQSTSKDREMGGALALGGCRFLNIYNNQMEVSMRGGLYIGEDVQLGWNVGGVTAPSFWLFN